MSSIRVSLRVVAAVFIGSIPSDAAFVARIIDPPFSRSFLVTSNADHESLWSLVPFPFAQLEVFCD